MMLGIDYAGVDGGHIEPAATGAHFAYVRASGGLTHDVTWQHDRPRWAAAGIPAGAYHWFNFHADPAAQARTFIASAGKRAPGEMPPALDLEADSAAALGMRPQVCLAAAEACLRELVAHYGTVMIYTSARVWADVFGYLPSALMSTCPLWLKVPYAWRALNPPHLDSASIPVLYSRPVPWRGASPWIVQFQGDAVGLPGTTRTVDLNTFLPRQTWDGHALDVTAFQRDHGLVPDGVIGPQTFAALSQS